MNNETSTWQESNYLRGLTRAETLQRAFDFLGWQGGTVHQVIRASSWSKAYDKRRYGRQVFQSRDLLLDGKPFMVIDEFAKCFPRLDGALFYYSLD